MSRQSAPGHLGALLALWNDIAPDGVSKYERWHSLEHVPERVAAPGFLAATRFESLAGESPRYFTQYELETLQALQTEAYRDLVYKPTPSTASMRRFFRNFIRKPVQLAFARGSAADKLESGVLTIRVVWPHVVMPDLSQLAVSMSELWPVVARGDVIRVLAGRITHAGPQALQNIDDAPRGSEWLFVLEVANSSHLENVGRDFDGAFAPLLRNATWHSHGRYRFSTRVLHSHVIGTLAPPRPGLIP